jgi:phosphoribosylformimino-5-aminoimidazole carboxamide ribotide isomerase
MQIIPVIDIVGGQAVAALRGQRADYRPLSSQLAPTSAPRDIVAGYLRLHPFETIYVADLDAIERRGGNRETIAELTEAFPRLRFWVDFGARGAADLRDWRWPRVDAVLGSESLASGAAPREPGGERRPLLSLDFLGDKFLGPEELLETPSLWPERVIVMTLARVGASLGPDIERIRAIKARAGDRRVYAAGGLRDARDLAALREAGAAGVLVATALHEGRLTPADLLTQQSSLAQQKREP